MAIPSGSRLGPYEVLSALGAGGMGEVYRARDSKLNRDVALKVLPEAFALDAERLARFKREAQVLASLNHPHIAAIYGFEDSGSVHALVLELVEGPTLADRIRQGPVPLDEALAIARQIGDALQAAHEQSIIHRDLKPANIKLRPDGTVKVLDFGLAKALEPASGMLADITNSPTITSPAMMTGQGVILGTAAYMSPEQAKGRLADKRSDVWAFGCVLYEMLTGRRPFEGEDVSDTLASVLKSDPEWTAIPASIPDTIRALIRRCLEKDRKRRIADISTALFIMEEPARNDSPAAPKRSGGRAGWIAAGVLLAVSATLGGMLYLRSGPAAQEPLRFVTSPPDGWALTLLPSRTSSAGTTGSVAVSPDGRRIAFLFNTPNGRSRLWIRSLDSIAPQELPGTDGAAGPFWSPDSRSIGFFADGRLKRIDVAGGPPLTLCEAPEYRGGTWSQDGIILFAPGSMGPVQRVSASGGVPAPVTVLAKDESGHGRPRFLPDGRHFFYSTYGAVRVYVGSLDSPDRTLLFETPAAVNVAYSQGHLLFMRDDTLMAQPFDPRRFVLSGEPVPVVQDVQRSGVPATGLFSVSDAGLLAYEPSTTRDVGSQLTWLDRAGKAIETVGDRAAYSDLELSPDGSRLAVSIAQGVGTPTNDIWLVDLKRGGVRTRLTSDPANDVAPIWSPDGRQISFDSDRKAGSGMYRKSVSGVGGEELLLRSEGGLRRTFSWSPEGRYLLYQMSRSGGSDLGLLPLDGGQPRRFLENRMNNYRARFSPDGRWVVYESSESARNEIYVVPFPKADSKVVVSVAGGSFPRWARNGKEIFYVDPDRRLVAAEVNVNGASFTVGAVKPLFAIDTPTIGRYGYDVSPDGQHFIVNAVREQSAAPVPVVVVTNWTAALKK